jgi:membrane protease YdiL (CAAX protease family)
MIKQTYISVLLIVGISALLVVTGIMDRPGLGIFPTIIIIGISLWLRKETLSSLGYRRPANWRGTIVRGFLYALAIYVAATLFIEPLSEITTNAAHDYSKYDGIRGNWLAAVQLIIVVWIFVAALEETIYRGFLMTEIFKIFGKSSSALVFNVLFTSLVFGLSHGYQNFSGVLSTGAIGALLAAVFMVSNFSIWEGIVAHGFIDTIGIILIATNGDIFIRHKILETVWNLPPQ